MCAGAVDALALGQIVVMAGGQGHQDLTNLPALAMSTYVF